jgi:hypothetical protein
MARIGESGCFRKMLARTDAQGTLPGAGKYHRLAPAQVGGGAFDFEYRIR